jgi:flagellar hook-associated protein 3 FlgL
MSSGISTYGFSLDMISQNTRLQTQMADIQKQISSGVKSQDYKGYNIDSLRLQNARIEFQSIEKYQYNIDTGGSKIRQMLIGVNEIEEQTDTVLDSISLLPEEGDIDIRNLKKLTENTLNIVKDILNTKLGDDFLFSGSDIKNAPLENPDSLIDRVQTQVTAWLDGTIDADTFLDNVGGYTDSQIGYSLGVQGSTDVSVRADDNFEVDYTVKANDQAYRDIVMGLTVISEIEFPDATTDLAERDDFYQIIDTLYKRVQGGIESLRDDQIKLSSAEAAIGRKAEAHKDEQGFLVTTIDNIQSVDPAEAIVKFQSLQSSLEASYQTTSIISSLSLARLL